MSQSQVEPIREEQKKLIKLAEEYQPKRDALDRENRIKLRQTKDDEERREDWMKQYTEKRDAMDKDYNLKRLEVIKQYHKGSQQPRDDEQGY